jgi:hypothetical protein
MLPRLMSCSRIFFGCARRCSTRRIPHNLYFVGCAGTFRTFSSQLLRLSSYFPLLFHTVPFGLVTFLGRVTLLRSLHSLLFVLAFEFIYTTSHICKQRHNFKLTVRAICQLAPQISYCLTGGKVQFFRVPFHEHWGGHLPLHPPS